MKDDFAQPHRVAIVGGGLSGLATAVHLHLADPSLAITLFESTDRLGGLIQSETVELDNGHRIVLDYGADMFATKPSAALRLCEKIGVADRLQLPNTHCAGATIVHRGKLVPIPDGFVLMRATRLWPIITTPLLSIRAKMRLLFERWIGASNASDDPDGDESVAQFVRHRMGKEVLQRIVGPLVSGIYTADIEKLSMLATMGPIAEMQRKYGSLTKATLARMREGQDSTERNSAGARYENFRSFPGGMAELINSLADSLPNGVIQTSTKVNAIQFDETSGTWSLHCGDEANDDEANDFDAVVLATPSVAAARLLSAIEKSEISDHAKRAAETLSSIESASTAIVILVVRNSDIKHPIEHFGFVVPAIENRRILAGSFASVKFEGRCSEEHTIIRVFFGGATQSELLANDDDSLEQIARDELAELIGLSGRPVHSQIVRWNQAMPQYHVGHLQRVREIDEAINKLPNLWLMGNALHGVGIAPIIDQAEKTAREIVQAFEGSSNSIA